MGWGYDFKKYGLKLSLNSACSFNGFLSNDYKKAFINRIKDTKFYDDIRGGIYDPLLYIMLKIQYDISKII